MQSIKINFLYSSILTTANYLFPLITFPYISRVLGVTNVGIVSFVDSIINYFILFSMMGINIVGIREIAKFKKDKQGLTRTFSSLFWLNTITTIGALVVLLVVSLSVHQLREHWNMMMVGAIKLFVNYLLIEWLYRGLEEFRYITIRTLVIRSVYVLAIFLFVKNKNDYEIYYFLTVLTIAINALINIIYSKHFVSFKIHKIELSRFFKPFFILGVYALLTSMYKSFNVAYLGFVCNETEVGYYATASKLHSMFLAFFSAFTGVMLPRMSSLISEGKVEEFKRLTQKSNNILFTSLVPWILFLTIYTPAIIEIIAGKGYEGSILPMRIVMPLLLVIGYEQILVVQTLMPLKKDDAILRNSLLGAIVGVFLNILLVNSFASIGSSIVWLISELVVLCSAQYYVSKYVGIFFPWNLFIKTLLYNVPLVPIMFLFHNYMPYPIWAMLFSIIFICFYFIVVNFFIRRNEDVVFLVNSLINRLSRNK